mmetsp:Transcript_60127/g.193554  ORF Transcript_60127/g.193554 Transcript_60127/m.193554 type:complete len:949 (-) Transcript_60127:85-2931(-)
MAAAAAGPMAFNEAVLVVLCLASGAAALPQAHTTHGGALLIADRELALKPVKGIKAPKKKQKDKKTWLGNLQCERTYKITSADNKHHRCPDACPYFAQDKTDDKFCSFRCVKDAEECATYNPQTIIADLKRGVCRRPMAQSCREYNMDGTDTCKVCSALYKLGPDGQCESVFKYVIYALAFVMLVVFVLVVVWLIDMGCRPATNNWELKEALEFRSQQKLRMSKEHGRHVWPLSTNLLRQTVAGPGMMLHFNFQFMVILWGVVVSACWIMMASLTDPALFILGTRSFGTPRDNCILVAWGYEKQQGLMWTKVTFLLIVYTITFIASILHSIRQLRIFQLYDFEHKTMKDFVAMVEGMPHLNGSERVEEELKAAVVEAGGAPVVGVSVAWDFQEHQETVMKLLDKDLIELEKEHNAALALEAPDEHHPDEEPPAEGGLRGKVKAFETSIFGPGEEEEDPDAEQHIHSLLESIQTSPSAFIVFETESGRDEAIEKIHAAGGLAFKGSTLTMEQQLSEPDTVEWHNFGHATTGEKILRLCKGFFLIFLALIFWTVVFYAPYAYSVFNFNYDNGQEPGPAYSISFSMVVVIGNQIMYEVCARVSDSVGFRFSDHKNVCYMILFTVACLYNVMTDMVTTYFMAEQIMEELGFRTYFGQRLSEIDSFTQKFETYAMQRSLAENTYAYAFPSTYLIPFLLEPIATVIGPLLIGVAIVRSHPEIKGRDAEGWVAAIPLDMGRYADILLNMVLGILIFYFPGGYTHWLFAGLAGSHVFVYYMDHCKLLRGAPALTIATMDVDWWSQLLMAPVTGLIMSVLIMKSNCETYTNHCYKGITLIAACSAGFIVHCIVHGLILLYVVPMFGKTPPEVDPCEGVTFKDINKHHATSWFTTNPVHCLRSLHFYKHDPPCRFWYSGKEHLMQLNEEIGCCFHDDEAPPEDFSMLCAKSGPQPEKK